MQQSMPQVLNAVPSEPSESCFPRLRRPLLHLTVWMPLHPRRRLPRQALITTDSLRRVLIVVVVILVLCIAGSLVGRFHDGR